MRSVVVRGAVFALLSCATIQAATAGERFGFQGRFLDTESVAALFNVDVPGGAVLVEHVDEGSPAAKAGLRGGAVPATIQGDDVLLGGDLIVQLEVHRLCAGECLQRAPVELERISWVGVTYVRGGRVGRTVIELEDIPLDKLDKTDADRKPRRKASPRA